MSALDARQRAERLITESQILMLPAESLDYDAGGSLRRALEARATRTILGPVMGHDNSRDPDRSEWVPVQEMTFHGTGSDDDEAEDYDSRPWCVYLAEVAVLNWKGDDNGDR